MFLDNFFVVHEKIRIIQKKLNLIKSYLSVIKIGKNTISDNRIMIVLANPYFNKYKDIKENYLIKDNIEFIKKILNIKIKIDDNNIHIKELLFNFNFDTNIYKIYIYYYYTNNPTSYSKIIYSTDKNSMYNIEYKKYEMKDNIDKYKYILNKYNKIMNFKNYNYFLTKKENNKLIAIIIELFKYTLKLNYNNIFKKICNNFSINEENIEKYIKKYDNSNYIIGYIGYSNDYVNIYLNNILI